MNSIKVCYRPSGTHQVRLVNGTHPAEGRVEVMYDEERGWGTVCSGSLWNNKAARVVCRELGLPFATAQAIGNGKLNNVAPHFGQGSGPIWLENVQCNGSEVNLDECAYSGWTAKPQYCNHTKDAGVICNGKLSVNKLITCKDYVVNISLTLAFRCRRTIGGGGCRWAF